MAQTPMVIGLFLCEQVVFEEGTGNTTLVNSFTRKAARFFPSEPFPFAIFAVLRDGRGDIHLDLAIERLETADIIYERSITGRFANQLQEWRYLCRIRNCSFPAPGAYEAALFANGKLIAQRRFRITHKEPNQ